jgi:hypothetical protein
MRDGRAAKSLKCDAGFSDVFSSVMSTPSIKGVAFQFVTSAVEELLAEGKLERAELETKLPEEDLALLDGEIIPGLWYPIASFGRLLELALAADGRSRERWPQVGFEAAEELLSAETYRGLVDSGTQRGDRSGFALVHLVPLFLNFSKWSFEPEPEDGSVYRVGVAEAEPMPDAAVALIQGIIEYLSQLVRRRRLSVSSQRVGRDRIIFSAQIPRS